MKTPQLPLSPAPLLALLPASLLALAAPGCRAGTGETAVDLEPTTAAAASPDASPQAPVRHVAATATAVEDLEVAFKQAIAAAGPAVVSIYTTKTLRVRGPGLPFGQDPIFERFFGPQSGQPQEYTQRGLGSGFIIDEQGHVLTNNHVVEGADEIRVRLADEREFVAELVGSDPPTDVALLKIPAEQLPIVELGDSKALEVGDWIVVIGDPYGLPQTVSVGIVSAKGRANVGLIDYEDFIQTDAAVNPGNSGGPVVDLEGRAVGISTAIASRGGGSEGIAFAIPIGMARSVIDQLLAEGKVSRGQLGVVISELNDDLAETFGYEGEEGILVQDVMADSAAAEAGLRSGDIITKLDGEAVRDVAKFRHAIARKAPGSEIKLSIVRGGKTQTLSATLGEAPVSATPAQQPDQPPKLGVMLEDVTPQLQQRYNLPEPGGVVITAVAPRSPAAAVDLQAGDVLVEVGDQPAESAAQAAKLIREADFERGVRLRVQRDGVGRYVFVKTGKTGDD